MCAKTLNIVRKVSSLQPQSFFVTTPIYYVNASPHIGHLYSSVIADAIQRWQQLLTMETARNFKLSTGTDEHGTKIQQAAVKNKCNPGDYCTTISGRYKDLADRFNVDYSDFVRTSDENHKRSVEKFWNVLMKKGKIYSSKYSGWYSVSDETFLTENQLKEKSESDGSKTMISVESGHPVEWIEEVNYMFPLGSLQEDLKYWLRTNESCIKPRKFHKLVSDTLSSPLPDISISRPSSRVHWAIHVPSDPSQTIYVWLDALVNYLTAAGYGGGDCLLWPPDLQVVGKDILKFHAIYWPAFLMCADLEPPRSILCHSHWTVDGEKMSKSKNNVVCPFQKSEMCTSEGLRYFLLREGVAHSDGNYSDVKLVRILNSELADTLGNLLSRCCGSALNPRQTFPRIEEDALRKLERLDVTKKLIEDVDSLPDICKRHYEDYNFYKAVDSIIATLHQANLFFETLKPWELKKQERRRELDVVLHLTLESLRVCSILMLPIIPTLANTLLRKIGCDKECSFQAATSRSWDDPNFVEKELGAGGNVMFQRIMTEKKVGRI